MNGERSRGLRAAEWLFLVLSSTSATLAIVVLVLNRTVGNLLDSLLSERGFPSSLVFLIVLALVSLGAGAAYVFWDPARRHPR